MKVQLVIYFIISSAIAHSQTVLSMDEAVHERVFSTKVVRIQMLSLEKAMLEYEVYKKSQLPLVSLNLNPVSFLHSLKLMQSYDTGSYSNVEEYSNTSGGDILLTQTICSTGGTLSLGSGINLLHEFSTKSNNFSSVPFYLKYSQDLFGGRKGYRLQGKVAKLRQQSALRHYCSSVAAEQLNILNLYLAAIAAQEKRSFCKIAVKTDSMLVNYAKHRLNLGKMTKYEYNEVELQLLDNKLELENGEMEYGEAIRLLEEELQLRGILLDELHVDALPRFIEENLVKSIVQKNSEQKLAHELNAVSMEYELHEAKKKNRFNGKVSFTYGLNQYGKNLRAAYFCPNQWLALSISMTVPIFQHGIGRSRMRMARTDLESAMLEKEVGDSEIETQVHSQVFAYNRNMRLFEFTQRKYELSSQQYDLARAEFMVGKMTATELKVSYENCLRYKQDVLSCLCSLYEAYYKIRHLALYDFVKNKELVDLFLIPTIQ